MRRVGILGGMGPQATVLLMQRLIDAVPARDDADHIPLLVDQNPQVPSRLAFLIDGRGEDPAPALARMARRLEAAGAEALAMPCNTAHHFAPAITAATGLPFLDMVAASVLRAETLAAGDRSIGILGSPALRRIGLFDRAFAASALAPIYPQDDAPLLAAIRSIKADGASDDARLTLHSASQELLDRGARVQLIACTEFSLIADRTAAGATSLDTLDLLVGLIRDFAMDLNHDRGADVPPTGERDDKDTRTGSSDRLGDGALRRRGAG
jgi:aspartate racemase